MKKIAKSKAIKAYKVFNPDWTCRGFEFKVGKHYLHEGSVAICSSGFHACLQVADCFSYYGFDSSNKIAEVLLWGQTDAHDEDSKVCASNIEIIRELSWQEVLVLSNTGKDCTGLKNSGDRNSGDLNSGNLNSGNRNSGNLNSGYGNSGNRNSGNRNSGNRNSGDRNSGDLNSGYGNSGNLNSGDLNSGNLNSGYGNSGNRNSGNRNSGNRNSGDRNSGNRNSGYGNSGNRNSGDRNSGNLNSGNRNSGDLNSGDLNSGYGNSGNRNSGDLNSGYGNSGNRNSGVFCENEPFVTCFDVQTNLKFDELNHPSMFYYDKEIWIYSENMTDEEKAENPFHETCGGYLKTISDKEMWQAGWSKDSDENKILFFNLPMFSLEKFERITGIDAASDYARLLKR